MNQKVLSSSLLILGTVVAMTTGALAEGLPRIAASSCPVVATAAPDVVCGDVELLAALPGVSLVALDDDGPALVDSRRVYAAIGPKGPDVQIVDIPIGSIKPTR